MATLISHNCYGLGTGQCVVDFGEYSQLSNPVFVNPVPMYQGFGGDAYQCTWWANARIYQLTGFKMGAWGDGACYGSVAMANGYMVYGNYQEALEAKGTLAGLVMSMGKPYRSYANCNNYTGCGALGSSNHVAICEGYDPDSGTIYVSEMWGSVANGDVLLNSYSRSSYSSCIQWIDLNVEATGGGGGYFKDKFGEFHWPVKPEKDARLPTSSEYQEFCDRLNEAQEEAGVENPTEFSATQDNNVLTAARFNEYLYLMQESTEGNLRGVDDEVELMEDVQREDVIYAKHFLQLEDLYNHWMYGRLQTGTDVPMNGSYAERVWDYLRSLGFSEAGAAGVLGNMMEECGGHTLNLNPQAQNPDSGAFGLVQWLYIGYYQNGMYVGMPFEDQLRYLGTNSYGSIQAVITRACGSSQYNALKNATSPENAALIFENCYEISQQALDHRQRHAREAYNAFSGRPLWTPDTGGGSATGTLGWPYAGGINCSRVSQKLGPYYGGTSGFDYDHRGWDIAYGYGTNIIAADGGTVIHAGWGEDVTYGISVTIDHGNGLFTRYAHMSNYAVSAGQTVSKGQIIGNEGTTGNVDGSHVHFEILQGNQWGTILNPYNYFPQCGN